jgi:hypothetical protein
MKRTFIVLSILAALGAYVYFVEIKGGEKREREKEQAAKLFPHLQENVNRLIIDNEHGTVELRRGDDFDTWLLKRPVSDAAEASVVNTLLHSLSRAEITSTLDDIDDLTPFGLHHPRVSIRLEGHAIDETIQVGGRSPVSQDWYVMRAATPGVLQVSGGLEGHADRKPEAFRDKQLLRGITADDVTKVVLTRDGRRIVLEKDALDSWYLVEPEARRADHTLVRGIVRDAVGLRAANWVAESAGDAELRAAGLLNPNAMIELHAGDARSVAISFGDVEGHDRRARVTNRSHIVSVADWSYEQIFKDPVELRDRNLMPDDVLAEATMIAFHAGDNEIRFQREELGWSVAGAVSGIADAAKVDALLHALAEYRANEWKAASRESRRQYELESPAQKIEAFDQEGNRLAALYFGREEDGWAVWARTQDTDAMAKAPLDFLQEHWPHEASAFLAGP